MFLSCFKKKKKTMRHPALGFLKWGDSCNCACPLRGP